MTAGRCGPGSSTATSAPSATGRRLYAEAKGRTAAPGLDVDTMFGQLLRRMPTEDDPAARYAVVVPTEALRAVQRIPARVLGLLRVDVYAVDAGGEVQLVNRVAGGTSSST